MSIGKEVGLGPGHIVLDGDPVGTQRPTAALPNFQPISIVANGRPSQQLLSSFYIYRVYTLPYTRIVTLAVSINMLQHCLEWFTRV